MSLGTALASLSADEAILEEFLWPWKIHGSAMCHGKEQEIPKDLSISRFHQRRIREKDLTALTLDSWGVFQHSVED